MAIDWIPYTGDAFGRRADVLAQLWRVVVDRVVARGRYLTPPSLPSNIILNTLVDPQTYHGEVISKVMPEQIESLTSAINFLCKTEESVFGSAVLDESWKYSSYVDSNTEAYTGPGSPSDGGVDNGGKDKTRRSHWAWYIERFRECLDALDNQRALAVGNAAPIPPVSAFDSAQARAKLLGYYNEFGDPSYWIPLPWGFESPSGGTLIINEDTPANITGPGISAVNNFGGEWFGSPNPIYRVQNTRQIFYVGKTWADNATLLTEQLTASFKADIVEEDDPFQNMSGDSGECLVTVQIWDGEEGDIDPDSDDGVIDFGSSLTISSSTPVLHTFPFTTRGNTDDIGDGTAEDGVFIAVKYEMTKGPQVDSYMASVRGYLFIPTAASDPASGYRVAYRKPIAEWEPST